MIGGMTEEMIEVVVIEEMIETIEMIEMIEMIGKMIGMIEIRVAGTTIKTNATIVLTIIEMVETGAEMTTLQNHFPNRTIIKIRIKTIFSNNRQIT